MTRTKAPPATPEEFYVHALAIEQEAAERYTEFESHFEARGEDALAGLCRELAGVEREHYGELVRASAHLTLPAIAATNHRWLADAGLETLSRDALFRIATPRQLLEIALAGEMRAREFFVEVARSAPSREVRELASVMAAEELEHVQWVTQALAYHET